MSKRLSWVEKFHNGKSHKIKTIEKVFGDMVPGDRMLVATPLMVDKYIRNIPLLRGPQYLARLGCEYFGMYKVFRT